MGVVQSHFGTGDNVGRDKIVIEKYIVNSSDYQNLVEEIEILELLIPSLTQNNDDEKLIIAYQRLGQLKEKEQHFKDTVFRLYETFNKYEINTERLQEAKEHFENGRFREADALLKINELERDQENLLNKKAQKVKELSQLERSLKSNSTEFLIKAQLTALRFDIPNWYEKTIEYFEKAIKSARTLKNLFEYALFLQKLTYFDKAKSLYKELLENYERLDEADSATYEPVAAMTLNNLATLCREDDDNSSVESAFKRALEIYERLAKANPSAYESYVATTLNYLAFFYQKNHDYPSAETAFKRALEIYEWLANANPVAYEPKVAITLDNLAFFYQKNHDYPSAETVFKRALEIYERLAKANPSAYPMWL